MANEWNKTAFVEFETMLRRRLRSGAAPVVACAGFDLDAASAYLEGALGGSYRAGYESHLAGCATCRRHLIELSRLAQVVPRAGTQPATVTGQTPAWVRCREIVAGWFNLSAWNLKWQMAGVAGAAFVILIAALSAQSRRQVSYQAGITTTPSATPATLAESGVQTLQSPTPESSPLNDELPVGEALIARADSQSRAAVPEPDVKLIDGLPTVADAPSKLNLPAFQTIEALPPNPRLDTQAEAQESRDSALQTQLSPQDVATLPPAGITPRLGITAANTGPRPTPTPGKKPSAPLILPKRVRRALTSLVPFSDSDPKPESDRKTKVDDSNDESSKIRRIKGKVFRFGKEVFGREVFGKNLWIDQEYKPEMQEWNIRTLKRGDESYKQVLADEPQLKEFFDHAPILIVWKDRIYKVPK